MIQLSPQATELAHIALKIRYFSSVGDPIDSPGVEAVSSWHEAIKRVFGKAWDNYCLDANNEVSEFLFLKDQDKFQTWNDVNAEINAIILPGVKDAIEAAMPASGRRKDAAVNAVYRMVLGACIEAHWAEMEGVPIQTSRAIFEWLRKGHLPCGALGEFPDERFMVF